MKLSNMDDEERPQDWIVTATSRWCCGGRLQIRLKLNSLRYGSSVTLIVFDIAKKA